MRIPISTLTAIFCSLSPLGASLAQTTSDITELSVTHEEQTTSHVPAHLPTVETQGIGEAAETSAPQLDDATLSLESGPKLDNAAYLAEIEFLTRRAHRQRASAAGIYAFSALPFGVGVGLTIWSRDFRQGPTPGEYGYNTDDAGHLARHIGSGFMAGATTLSLMAGMPLTRSSHAHLRAAEELILNPSSFESWNRNKHLGAIQQRTGRNLLFGAAASGLSLAVSGIVHATADDYPKRARSRALAISSATTMVALAIPGTALWVHGQSLERKERPSSKVSAQFTPIILPDGAGASLWMGF